jgi:hypothetical protein
MKQNNKQSKWLWLIVGLMLLPLGVKAQGAKSYELVIEKTNGQTLRLPISSDGQISVGYEDVIVGLGSETLFLTMDDIAKMYAEKTTTGISRPTDNTVSIELGHNQTVVLSGLKDNTEVIFADLSGKVLLREKVTSRTTTISTTSLPAGTYIVKTSFGETLKFTKQ